MSRGATAQAPGAAARHFSQLLFLHIKSQVARSVAGCQGRVPNGVGVNSNKRSLQSICLDLLATQSSKMAVANALRTHYYSLSTNLWFVHFRFILHGSPLLLYLASFTVQEHETDRLQTPRLRVGEFLVLSLIHI